MDRLTLYGNFTSSSSYKPMLYLALARLPFSFCTVNLKAGVQRTPEYLALNRWGVVPSLRHRGLTILQSNVILDYLARETGHFEGRTEQQCWQAREWLSWEADHITYVAKVRHSARFRASHPETIAEFRPRAEAALSFVDKTVKDFNMKSLPMVESLLDMFESGLRSAFEITEIRRRFRVDISNVVV